MYNIYKPQFMYNKIAWFVHRTNENHRVLCNNLKYTFTPYPKHLWNVQHNPWYIYKHCQKPRLSSRICLIGFPLHLARWLSGNNSFLIKAGMLSIKASTIYSLVLYTNFHGFHENGRTSKMHSNKYGVGTRRNKPWVVNNLQIITK